GTDGIKVQQKIGSEWVDVYYVDENGNVKYAGHLEGATGTFSGRLEGAWVKGGWLDLIGDVDSEEYRGQLNNVGLFFDYISEYPETETRYYHDSISYKRLYAGSSRNEYFTFDMDEARFTGTIFSKDNLVDSIVEQGSNANGQYIRYDNGIQICWTKRTVNANVASAQGSIFVSGTLTWTFPA